MLIIQADLEFDVAVIPRDGADHQKRDADRVPDAFFGYVHVFGQHGERDAQDEGQEQEDVVIALDVPLLRAHHHARIVQADAEPDADDRDHGHDRDRLAVKRDAEPAGERGIDEQLDDPMHHRHGERAENHIRRDAEDLLFVLHGFTPSTVIFSNPRSSRRGDRRYPPYTGVQNRRSASY